MTVYPSKVRGAMYGVAIGDALGAPLEFMSAESIKLQHGIVREMIGGGWLNVKPGEITDDTQMTLCVAHGIEEAPENPAEAIGRNFVRWYMERPKDVGATCASSISMAMRLAKCSTSPSAKDWRKASREVDQLTGGKSGGNGALMRTAYVGLYYQDTSTVISRAAQIAQMTHYDKVAAADCAAYSLMLHSLTEEEAKNGKQIITDVLLSNTGTATRYDPQTLSSDDFIPTPSGWGVASFRSALHCIFTTDSFEEALVKAVNLGGDADTIGAITGGLAGALYGYDSIPERWKAILDRKVALELDALCDTALTARKTEHPIEASEVRR